MITIFSAYDDRARPKGSRDAIGAEAVWSHLGRKIVGNLTTVTSNLDNFMVALLCCHYAHQTGRDAPSSVAIQERYLRAEQVAAYLKLADQSPTGFLGITRARKNFAESRILLGAAAEAQLLANQAAYGLWGLYSSALEAAGLISGANRRPSASGAALIAEILGRFGSARWEKFCTLAGAGSLDKTACSALAPHFTKLLSEPALRATVVHALLASQRDCALQAELFPLAQAYLAEHQQVDVGAFCAWILAKAGPGDALKTALRRIVELDPLLALADTIMLWLQTKHGETLTALVQVLQPHLTALTFGHAWQEEAELPHRDFLKTLRAAAMNADAEATIRAILEQNRALMRARGGAAWIDIDGAGRLVVLVRNDHPQDLGRLQTLDAHWLYNYFLASFLMITQQGQA